MSETLPVPHDSLPEGEAVNQTVMDRFYADLFRLYAELDRELQALGVRCALSGRCCRFDEWGHRLYLTWPEARLLAQEPPPQKELHPGRCPYQVDNLCTAHARRPLGCRVYFCDPAYKPVMNDLAERYHQRLKQLFVRYGLPWRYGPLHAMLAPLLTTTGRAEQNAATPQ